MNGKGCYQQLSSPRSAKAPPPVVGSPVLRAPVLRALTREPIHCTLSVVQFAVIFKLNPSGGQPIYLQIMQQIQHAVETGVLQDGDLMPGIRTLAEELAVSHNTIAKAYTELEHEGLLELRHGSGAYISARRGVRSRTERVRGAQERVRRCVEDLQEGGLTNDQIRRLFEAQLLLHEPTAVKKR